MKWRFYCVAYKHFDIPLSVQMSMSFRPSCGLLADKTRSVELGSGMELSWGLADTRLAWDSPRYLQNKQIKTQLRHLRLLKAPLRSGSVPGLSKRLRHGRSLSEKHLGEQNS